MAVGRGEVDGSWKGGEKEKRRKERKGKVALQTASRIGGICLRQEIGKNCRCAIQDLTLQTQNLFPLA